MGKSTKARQLSLVFGHKHGGWRRGAGRKPAGAQAGVAHRPRVEFVRRSPVFVTQRIAAGLPSLRRPEVLALFRDLVARLASDQIVIVHWSLLSNHVHMIVEAEDSLLLARKLGGFLGELAKRLNRLWERRGNVFPDRFDARVLTTPMAVRTALVYTLGNGRKHGAWRGRGPDTFSSGVEFDGWRDWVAESSSLPRARSWLLKLGWRRHGPIGVLACPKSGEDEWEERLHGARRRAAERKARARASSR